MYTRRRLGSFKIVLQKYRQQLYVDGEQDSARLRAGFNKKRVEKVLAQGGELSQAQMMHCKVRYFVDGGVIGSKVFVNEQFEIARSRFGAKRQSGARRIRHVIPEMFSLRDLQLRKFG